MLNVLFERSLLPIDWKGTEYLFIFFARVLPRALPFIEVLFILNFFEAIFIALLYHALSIRLIDKRLNIFVASENILADRSAIYSLDLIRLIILATILLCYVKYIYIVFHFSERHQKWVLPILFLSIS